jgi:hypothetical protein
MSTSHVLIWKETDGSPPIGSAGLLGWTKFSLERNPHHFFRCAEGQIGILAAEAVQHAVARACDVTIAWGGTPNFRATPAHCLEETFRQLRPSILVCQERPGGDRWACSVNFGAADSLPAAAIQRAVSDQVATLFPHWQHDPRNTWTASAFLLRHGVSAEELGLVGPRTPTSDDIVAELASDPAVREAYMRADPALPETLRALVAARLSAQAERGIPADRRVTHYTGEVEDLLLPLTFKLGRGEGLAGLAMLRRQLGRVYGDLTDAVLAAALRTFPHENLGITELREAAKATDAAAA